MKKLTIILLITINIVLTSCNQFPYLAKVKDMKDSADTTGWIHKDYLLRDNAFVYTNTVMGKLTLYRKWNKIYKTEWITNSENAILLKEYLESNSFYCRFISDETMYSCFGYGMFITFAYDGKYYIITTLAVKEE